MSTLKTNEELVAEIQKGINTEENKVQLYRQNKGLILRYAKKYMADRTDEDELQDYLSEGYFAVEKACNYYDAEKGANFATILYSFLRNCFRDYVCRGRLVHIPCWVRGNDIKYSKAKTGLLMEKGEADEAEIMERCGVTKRNAELVRAANKFSVIKSLDEPVIQPDGSTLNLAEIMADDLELEKGVIDGQIEEILWECVDGILTGKRLEVLKMHFQDELSISQIAREKGISRQAVHSMLKQSIDKLRKSKKLQKIYESL